MLKYETNDKILEFYSGNSLACKFKRVPIVLYFFFSIQHLAFDQAEQKKSNRVTTAITITHGTQHMGRSGSCYPYCSTAVAVRVAAATTKKNHCEDSSLESSASSMVVNMNM